MNIRRNTGSTDLHRGFFCFCFCGLVVCADCMPISPNLCFSFYLLFPLLSHSFTSSQVQMKTQLFTFHFSQNEMLIMMGRLSHYNSLCSYTGRNWVGTHESTPFILMFLVLFFSRLSAIMQQILLKNISWK